MPYEGLALFPAFLVVAWWVLIPVDGLLLHAVGWKTTAVDRLHASAFAVAPLLLSLTPIATLLAFVAAHGYRAYAYRTVLRVPWPEALLGALAIPVLLLAAFIRLAAFAPA